MATRLLTIEQTLTQLTETPKRIAALTAGMPPALLSVSPGADEWSANEVLAHLRACGDVWGDHIAAILAEDHPTRQGMNPRTWIERTAYRELEFDRSFRSFRAQRAKLLAVLDSLPPEAWTRTATVMGWGMANEKTLESYAEHLARHERPHLKQIERIVRTVQA